MVPTGRRRWPLRPEFGKPSPDADRDGDHSSGPADDALTRSELRRRASAGVLIVGTRGLVIMLLGFVGNIIVARLLAPREFGVVAIGMTFVFFAGLISDGGLGAGLIRRDEPPTRDELGALSALQLGITSAGTLVAATVAAVSPFGQVGWVTAIMVASMPLVALQFPGRILLERSLRYQRLAMVELTQVICYQAWAIGTVIAGFGVWGLATATVVRAATGALAMALACREGRVRPRFSARLIKPLIRFGLQFQAVNAVWILGDQLLNVTVAAISGIAALGLWTLARRMTEVPSLLFVSLSRVSFPTMSRLVASKEDVGPLVERAAGMTAVGTGFVLTAMVGSAPGLVPGLFGNQWREASTILPGACLALLIGGSISVATQSYLYAIDDAKAVLRAEVLQLTAWFAVTLPLLPVIGVASIGLGWTASALTEAAVLVRATSRRLRVRLLPEVLGPVVVGLGSASAGWVIATRAGSDLLSGALGGVTSVLLFAAGLAVSNRQRLRMTYRFAAESVRAAFSRRQHDDAG